MFADLYLYQVILILFINLLFLKYKGNEQKSTVKGICREMPAGERHYEN